MSLLNILKTPHISPYQIQDPLEPFESPTVKTSQDNFSKILPLLGVFELGHYTIIQNCGEKF